MVQFIKILPFIVFLSYNVGFSQVENLIDEKKYEKVETKDFIAYFPQTTFEIENKNNRQTSSGKGTVNIWTLKGSTGDKPFIYQVSQSIMTAEMIDAIEEVPNTLNVLCNGTMMSFASKLGGEAFEFYPLNENGLKGMTSTCKVFDGEGTISSKAFRIDNYLYMISAGGKEIDMEMVNAFLRSFKPKI